MWIVEGGYVMIANFAKQNVNCSNSHTRIDLYLFMWRGTVDCIRVEEWKEEWRLKMLLQSINQCEIFLSNFGTYGGLCFCNSACYLLRARRRYSIEPSLQIKSALSSYTTVSHQSPIKCRPEI